MFRTTGARDVVTGGGGTLDRALCWGETAARSRWAVSLCGAALPGVAESVTELVKETEAPRLGIRNSDARERRAVVPGGRHGRAEEKAEEVGR